MIGAIALAAALPAQVVQVRPVVKIEAPAAADPAITERVEESARSGALAASAWLERALPGGPLPLRWFESHEAMGQSLGAADFVLDDSTRGDVAFTFGSGRTQPVALPDDGRVELLAARAGACAALRKLAPNSTHAMRTALAEFIANPACAPECTRLAATLRSLHLLPTLEALLDSPRPLSPELTRIAWISLFVALPTASRFEVLNATDANAAGAWSSSLDSASSASETIDAPTRHDATSGDSPPMRGFCFAHEGYRWLDGYGSRAAFRSLARVKELGANAVSLTPFAFQRDVGAPAITALFERGGGPGPCESDASIGMTAADARSLGLTVVLKPHLWCGRGDRSHAWCGEISMNEEADWPEWFAEYERIAVHYALLARRCGIPVLCVGTELQGTTRSERCAQAWRELLRKVRALFPGVVTYCANWGEEVESLPFWGELDVVGVSAYWPLADAPGATPAVVVRRFADVLERMETLGRKTQRPVWFLEIGFPDVSEPWIKPNEKAGEPDGGVDQGLAYRVVLQTTRDRGFPEALFWWKWPSDFDLPGRRGPEDRRRDFWPCGRPAERELARAWAATPAGGTTGR